MQHRMCPRGRHVRPEDGQENDLYGGSKGGEVDFPVRLFAQ